MWLLAVLLGNDLSHTQILHKLHELLYNWSTNKCKNININININRSINNDNMNTNLDLFLNNIIKTIPNRFKQTKYHQYKMTSQETMKVYFYFYY